MSKIFLYEFWFDYVIPEFGEKGKLCYIDTDSFIVYVKTDDISKDIAEDVETRFDTSNFELDRPLPKGKYKKIIGLMKDELSRKIMTKFVTYSYLIDDDSEDKKAKGTKNYVTKRDLKFEKLQKLFISSATG